MGKERDSKGKRREGGRREMVGRRGWRRLEEGDKRGKGRDDEEEE